jgi:hypothetical protein
VPGSQSTPVRNIEPLDMVDEGLRLVSGRPLISRDEAIEILERVRASAPEAMLGATICALISDARASYSDQLILDGLSLADQLLDIRSALGS